MKSKRASKGPKVKRKKVSSKQPAPIPIDRGNPGNDADHALQQLVKPVKVR